MRKFFLSKLIENALIKIQNFRKETNEESESSSKKPSLSMEEIVDLRGPDSSKNNPDENLIMAVQSSLEDDE